MLIAQQLKGVVSTLLYSLVTFFIMVPLLVLALLKRVISYGPWQKTCSAWSNWFARTWIHLNGLHQSVLLRTRLRIEGDLDLSMDERYMLICNHQSWVDILVLLRVFKGRIPYVKFFLKKSLIWMPLVGACCWALDFPFMRRYTQEEIARNPSLKGRDLRETRAACEKYRHTPVTIINFLEGTRFTEKKHQQQNSPYRHLLIPKAGGLAFTLAAMDGLLHSILDVTICYPDGIPTYWEYACGKVRAVNVHVRQLPIPDSLVGDYPNDPQFRQKFIEWLDQRWREKDERMELLSQTGTKD